MEVTSAESLMLTFGDDKDQDGSQDVKNMMLSLSHMDVTLMAPVSFLFLRYCLQRPPFQAPENAKVREEAAGRSSQIHPGPYPTSNGIFLYQTKQSSSF